MVRKENGGHSSRINIGLRLVSEKNFRPQIPMTGWKKGRTNSFLSEGALYLFFLYCRDFAGKWNLCFTEAFLSCNAEGLFSALAVEEFAKTFSRYNPFVEDYFGNQEPLTMIGKGLQELESINGDGEAKMYSALRIVNCINNITEQFALYAEMWKTGNNQEKCRELSDQITNRYFDVVYEFIKTNQLKRAFIISDFAMGTYSLTGSRCKNEYLTDIVESIVHITNYNVLWRKTQRFPPDEIYNRIYGDHSDSALQQIESWLCGMCNQHKNMHFINGDDNFSLPENERNAYIVYGHGVHGDRQRDAADGAVGIWCDNHILTVKDILKDLETQNIDFFILMSCSGGMPVGQDPERDQGSWVHMIERLRGGIISCHWDVKVEAVCCFLATLLKELNNKEGMIGRAVDKEGKEYYPYTVCRVRVYASIV